jgi:hypothetical protein
MLSFAACREPLFAQTFKFHVKFPTNQQATPTKKTAIFNRNRTPLGIKSANAAVELPPVVVNKFTDDSTQQQVKSDQEFASRLQNSIDEDVNQFQVSVLGF